MNQQLELHTHSFVRGPRSGSAYRNGVWDDGKVTHSHEGGGAPHSHPDCGPAFYGYRKPKTTAKPKGEQFELIPATEDESSFDLIVTDSALMSVARPMGSKLPGLVPIGDTPLDVLGFPAARTIMLGSRLKCIVHDERKCMKGKRA